MGTSNVQHEPYVNPDRAAEFLAIEGKDPRLAVIRMARSGQIPAHPLKVGKRRQWRFKISELDAYMQGGVKPSHPPVRQ